MDESGQMNFCLLLGKIRRRPLPIWGILLFCSSGLVKMYYWLKVDIYRFSTKRNSWLRVAIFHSIALKLSMPSVTAVPVSNSGKALCKMPCWLNVAISRSAWAKLQNALLVECGHFQICMGKTAKSLVG